MCAQLSLIAARTELTACDSIGLLLDATESAFALSERVGMAALQLMGTISSISDRAELGNCLKLLVALCPKGAHAVVRVGALELLATFLRPEGGLSCILATKALQRINKGRKLQAEVFKVGAVELLVLLLKMGNLDARDNACRALFWLLEGHAKGARDAMSAFLALGGVAPLMTLLNPHCQILLEIDQDSRRMIGIVKYATMILVEIVHNAAARVDWEESFRVEGVHDALMLLVQDDHDARNAHVYKALVALSVSDPRLRLRMACRLAELSKRGVRMVAWFDVIRGIGIMAWRCEQLENDFAVVAMPLLVSGISNTSGLTVLAASCAMMGLARIGMAEDFTTSVMFLVVTAIYDADDREVKARLAKTLAAISRKEVVELVESYTPLCNRLVDSVRKGAISSVVMAMVSLLNQNCSNEINTDALDTMGCIADHFGHVDTVVDAGALASVGVALVQKGHIETSEMAAMVIGNLAFKGTHATTILRMDLLPHLLRSLQSKTGGGYAAMALASLSMHTDCALEMLVMGVVASLVHASTTDLVLAHCKPTTCAEAMRQWREAFGRAWATVALISLHANDVHDAIGVALQQIANYLSNCQEDFRMELAKALLESLQKQAEENPAGLSRNPMVKTFLDILSSTGSTLSIKYTESAMRYLDVADDTKREADEQLPTPAPKKTKREADEV